MARSDPGSRANNFDALRLIAITGHSSDEERAKSRRAGFDAHLLKPASPDLVDSILTQFFSRPG